jgi:nucleoside-diphosphate kinase
MNTNASIIFCTLLALICLTSCRQKEVTYPHLKKEATLSIIKPDAVEGNHIGDIISRFETNGLRIAGIKLILLDKQASSAFYDIHRGRPFYEDLTTFMSSGPVVVMVLEGDDAISKNRSLMGATDPEKAEEGTIRKDFASSITKNAVHGSDSKENAEREIRFFFQQNEIQERF